MSTFFKNLGLKILSFLKAKETLPESNVIRMSMTEFLGMQAENLDDSKPLQVIVHSKAPINIHFEESIALTSDRNLMIATPNGETHFNPFNFNKGVAVDYRALNQYVEDSNLQLLESPKVDSDCECLDCNPKQVIIDENTFNTMLEDMKHMKQRLSILERRLNNKE